MKTVTEQRYSYVYCVLDWVKSTQPTASNIFIWVIICSQILDLVHPRAFLDGQFTLISSTALEDLWHHFGLQTKPIKPINAVGCVDSTRSNVCISVEIPMSVINICNILFDHRLKALDLYIFNQNVCVLELIFPLLLLINALVMVK